MTCLCPISRCISMFVIKPHKWKHKRATCTHASARTIENAVGHVIGNTTGTGNWQHHWKTEWQHNTKQTWTRSPDSTKTSGPKASEFTTCRAAALNRKCDFQKIAVAGQAVRLVLFNFPRISVFERSSTSWHFRFWYYQQTTRLTLTKKGCTWFRIFSSSTLGDKYH